MKRKKLPNKKHKGLYIYCNDCQKYFSWTSKSVKNEEGKTEKNEPNCGKKEGKLSSCASSDKHRYKSRIHIPGTKDRKISRTFRATSYSDAVIEAIEFEKEFRLDIKLNSKGRESSRRYYLFDCQIQYIDFLDNVGVPAHQRVQRSEKHIKEVQTCLLLFNESLTKNQVNKKLMLVDKISDEHIGFFHSYLLEDKGYSGKTYNNKMAVLRGFFKWSIEKFKLNIYNPLEKVKSRSTFAKKDTITQKEFQDLLNIISPENGISTTIGKRKTTRNRYKPYLKDGIELSLHTGGRREEVADLKWNMIVEQDNVPLYIKIKNLKIERQKGEGYDGEVAPKIIPITKSLKKLLYRMGYENKKGSDEFLLSPDRSKTSTYAIIDNLSKGFSHFYNQLNTGRNLQLKSLRKTYLTYLSATLQGDAKSLSSHTTDAVLQKHYIDERIIDKAVKELDIFNS